MILTKNLILGSIFLFALAIVSYAGGTVDPTITKSLNDGLNPVGLGKDGASIYKFTINIDGDYDSDGVVKDVLPAEFDAIGICSAGSVGDCCETGTDCDTTATCDTGNTDQCIGGDNDGPFYDWC